MATRIGRETPTLSFLRRPYTLPRPRENSRVKDLPVLALLAQTGPFDGGRLRAALDATFDFRNTHGLPSALPAPPSAWGAPYARMALMDTLPWPTLDAVAEAARAFLEPALHGAAQSWDPAAWCWR